MNIREILEHVASQNPEIGIHRSTDKTVDSDWFRLYLQNGWMINVGYSRRDYSSNRVIRLENSMDADKFEISVFKPNGDYFIAEDMVTWIGVEGEPPTQGYYGWADSTKLFEIMDYIAKMDDTKVPKSLY